MRLFGTARPKKENALSIRRIVADQYSVRGLLSTLGNSQKEVSVEMLMGVPNSYSAGSRGKPMETAEFSLTTPGKQALDL